MLKGVDASVVGFEIGVTVMAAAALLAVNVSAVAGVLPLAARLADVEAGKTATTRAFGTFPVQRFPPYAPTKRSEPSMLLAMEICPLVPTD